MTRMCTAWGGKTYIYYFWSFDDAKPVPPPWHKILATPLVARSSKIDYNHIVLVGQIKICQHLSASLTNHLYKLLILFVPVILPVIMF